MFQLVHCIGELSIFSIGLFHQLSDQDLILVYQIEIHYPYTGRSSHNILIDSCIINYCVFVVI